MKRHSSVIALAITLAVVGLSVARADEAKHNPKSLGFIKGHSWGWAGGRGSYGSPAAAESLAKLADTGANWVCISFAPDMKAYDTPEFEFGDANPNLVTDDELRHAIAMAREHGLRPILKPVVNSADGVWRAWIRFYRPVTDAERAAGVTGEFDPWGEVPKLREGEVKDLAKWDLWWNNFTQFILHYAKLAEEQQVPVLCLGCEMNSTEEFEDKWRTLIGKVRDVYHGQITYDFNHGNEEQVKWLDALDFISISAYYPVPFADGRPLDSPTDRTTSVEEIRAALMPIRGQLAAVSKRWQKPILFIETGVTPVRGCAHTPWAHVDERADRPTDQLEQAHYYQAMFETFWDEPWFMGWCWWDWPAQLYDRKDAAGERGFCIYGKPAERVLREWYAKPHAGPDAQ